MALVFLEISTGGKSVSNWTEKHHAVGSIYFSDTNTTVMCENFHDALCFSICEARKLRVYVGQSFSTELSLKAAFEIRIDRYTFFCLLKKFSSNT
jgi:hypothetical protein